MKRDVPFKVGFVSVVMRVIEKKGHERRRLTPIPIRHYSDPNESGIFHLLPRRRSSSYRTYAVTRGDRNP